MSRLFVVIGILVSLSGCAHITGRINTASYVAPPQKLVFIVVMPDPLSLTDRNIGMLIERKMFEQGCNKATSEVEANVAVLFKYGIGAGTTEVHSYTYEGKVTVSSDTTYPRFFQVAVVDLLKSKLPEKVEIIWQGELKSKGSLDDMSRLAPYFIDALFEHYGSTVTNEKFFKRLER